MFIDSLLSQDSSPLVEQWLKFTESRHRVLAEDIANVDVPGYRQKDLSLTRFQSLMRDRVAKRDASAPGTVRFDDLGQQIENPTQNILFHDGGNRSMEQLMSEHAKNALMHQLAVELLKKQFSQIEMALRERL